MVKDAKVTIDDDKEPEWLTEGLETIEDEDIFASKKDAAGEYNKKVAGIAPFLT